MNEYQVGDVVRLSAAFHSALAFIYELYDDFDHKGKHGVSVITETGADLGGFSFDEQKDHMTLVCRTGKQYEFRGVIWVDRDFRTGWFEPAFKKARVSHNGEIGERTHQPENESKRARSGDGHSRPHS